MMSAALKLAIPQCGPGVLQVARPKSVERSKDSCSLSQPKSTSFTRRSTWDLQNWDHCRERNALLFGVERKASASRQAITSVIRDMSSAGDTQNGDKSEFHQVKLIDGNPFLSVGNHVLIKGCNGKELKVEYMPDYSPHDQYLSLNDIGTSSMYLQSLTAPACVLAITTTEQIVDQFKDQSKLNQFLYKGITEENGHIRFTGVWLSKEENGKYKLTCGVYFKDVKRECKLHLNIRMLKLALMHNIPIYVHSDLLRHKRPILGRSVLEVRRTAISQRHTPDPTCVASKS